MRLGRQKSMEEYVFLTFRRLHEVNDCYGVLLRLNEVGITSYCLVNQILDNI